MKYVIIVLIVTGFACANEEDDHKIIDAIKPEKPCNAVGGMCTVKADCPKAQLSRKQGLCPNQRNQGIECCHGISMKETRCNKFGGECRKSEEYCNPIHIVNRAKNCRNNEKCCVLV